MPTLRTASDVFDECALSWTTGMPVHPEPASAAAPARLPRKDLRDLAVLSAVGIISIIAFVPPLAGLAPGDDEPAALVSRDLPADIVAAPSIRPRAPQSARAAAPVASAVAATRRDLVARPASATSFAARPILVHASLPVTRRGAARGDAPRAVASRLGRVLTGDGRHRVQPFPRPTDFEY